MSSGVAKVKWFLNEYLGLLKWLLNEYWGCCSGLLMSTGVAEVVA